MYTNYIYVRALSCIFLYKHDFISFKKFKSLSLFLCYEINNILIGLNAFYDYNTITLSNYHIIKCI